MAILENNGKRAVLYGSRQIEKKIAEELRKSGYQVQEIHPGDGISFPEKEAVDLLVLGEPEELEHL